MMRVLKSCTDIEELKRCRSIILRDFLARRDELMALKKSVDKVRETEIVVRVFAEAFADHDERINELRGPQEGRDSDSLFMWSSQITPFLKDKRGCRSSSP
jgi:hypothetical protein